MDISTYVLTIFLIQAIIQYNNLIFFADAEVETTWHKFPVDISKRKIQDDHTDYLTYVHINTKQTIWACKGDAQRNRMEPGRVEF